MNTKRMMFAATTAVVGALTLSSPAQAVTCDQATFTSGGQFDLDGYLACLSGGAGGLPSTGSDVAQYVALGVGAVAMGVAARVVAVRRRNVLVSH
jgi:hypothetical protein